MNFLIVIPAHNEEAHLEKCLNSLKNQTLQNFFCVVVDDGSSDKTGQIAQDYANALSNFEVLHLEKSTHEPGAKVVRTFNKALEKFSLDQFDGVCKFDADIVFPEDYLEKITHIYQQNPNAGMVSGLVYIKKNGEWEYESLSNKNHVRGPIKSYRKNCFEQMNGLRPVLGWDNIDTMLAKMNGFDVMTIKDLWVKHLRPTAYKYKNQKAEKLGEYFYNIGLSFPLALVSSAKSSLKNRSILEFATTIRSFLKQKNKRSLSEEEIRFIRKLRWNQIFGKEK